MKLFRVTATYYVAADTESDCDFIRNDPDASDIEADEISDVSDIDSNWLDALPFGRDGTQTCREIVEAPDEPA